ncbi:MAG: ABC transporter substrate-binding protein [Chloroflexota bacterium]|nr:ABC transporter substrate-binding protein [Chloroflexota bacterium]
MSQSHRHAPSLAPTRHPATSPRRRVSHRARVLVPLAGAALLIGARMGQTAWGQGGEPVSVALDWYPNANHAGLFLADARGTFAAAGLGDVTLTTPADPTTVLQTVAAGRDTLGISYQTDVLLARAQGVPVVSVAAIAGQPLLGVMSLAETAIGRPADLAGRTVGYPGIPSQEAFLATMLEADGRELGDVELVNVGFDLLPALFSGRAEAVMGAYWTHETILADRQGYPNTILRVEEWGVPPYYELVLVAGEETLAAREEDVAGFVAAMVEGYRAAIADPTAALDALAAASPELDRDVEEEGLRLLAGVWSGPGEGRGAAFGTQVAARWDAYGAWMVDRGLIPADLDIAAAWTDRFVPLPAATPAASPASGTPATPPTG